ncbi:HAD family hydrolase [Coprobacter tertius]|uniref:phosphoglycolate phosphatase n=1 Tax=Coprobacter tertius TaxID=2944915 RepID=A0ABT1MKB1_9BACT|nr:HAD family hydrolase [Coprobacter tertius]MCP9613057.1 HAD family hydrolase [Coprobacter tertius]
MKKLVIFDLDGTLLNTIDDLAVSTNFALSCCGFPEHKVSQYKYFVGNGIAKLFERALPENERNEQNIARMRMYFLEHYTVNNTCHTVPYDGIPDLLRSLADQDVKLAVASNKYQQGTEKLIDYYFGDIPFIAVLGQREGVPVKPDPVIIEEILGVAGISRDETLYTGDSGVDMQTAKNAGVESVGVTWGFRSKGELLENGACHVVDYPGELLKYMSERL